MKYNLRATLITNLLFIVFAAGSLGQTSNLTSHRSVEKVRGQQRQSISRAFNLKDLVRKLRAYGATVKLGRKVSQPFFPIAGRSLAVNNEQVQVFEFKTASAALVAARKISADGSPIGTTMITWIAPPHFYRNGKIIVLYVGENSSVTKTLENVLGHQFAGR